MLSAREREDAGAQLGARFAARIQCFTAHPRFDAQAVVQFIHAVAGDHRLTTSHKVCSVIASSADTCFNTHVKLLAAANTSRAGSAYGRHHTTRCTPRRVASLK